MPAPIQRSIRRQNIRFLHTKNQFFVEFVQFIRKLVGCNSAGQPQQQAKPVRGARGIYRLPRPTQPRESLRSLPVPL